MIIDSIGARSGELLLDRDSARVSSQKPGGISSSLGVRTTLGFETISVKSLVAKALQTPEVRLDKVQALQQSIREGTYDLSSPDIAASMLQGRVG